MDLESLESHKRHTLTLQLAPMIDIFFLIIIFLLKSTIVADVSIIFPGQMHPPLSKSREALETFPEIVLDGNHVILGFMNEKKSIEDIQSIKDEELQIMKAKVEAYIKSKDEKVRAQFVNVNFITSRENRYDNVFAVVRFLRKIGFQSVQFIAEGESN